MVNTAEQTARNAEAATTNKVGMCLQQCRTWANIPALHGTAAIAAAHAMNMHRDRDIPRGAFAYWTGGSSGAGHIAIGLGGGLLRSTDADGAGRVATRDLAWFDSNWPDLAYVGWADNVNGETVPGVGDDDMADAATQQKLDDILTAAREAVSQIGRLRSAETDRAVGDRKRDEEVAAALAVLALDVRTKAGSEQVRKLKKLLLAHDAEPHQ
jgi:hypothetical protein